jgi:hypothetical protein
MATDSEFEEGRILGHAQEQRRLENYFHEQLAPDLMTVAFSLESIRAELEVENHPAASKLREVQNRLSEILAPVRHNFLSGTDDGSESMRGPLMMTSDETKAAGRPLADA